MNSADTVVLTIIVSLCWLIIRGMLRGAIRTCDPASCGGSCAKCKEACQAPRIELNDDQLAQLRALDERGHLT